MIQLSVSVLVSSISSVSMSVSSKDDFTLIPAFTSFSLQFPAFFSTPNLLDLLDRFTSLMYLLFLVIYPCLFIQSLSFLCASHHLYFYHFIMACKYTHLLDIASFICFTIRRSVVRLSLIQASTLQGGGGYLPHNFTLIP